MYKLIFNTELKQINSVYRLSDMAIIQFDLNSTDYQAYLAWLELGNTPLPADEVTL
jgi:hypothetical protein